MSDTSHHLTAADRAELDRVLAADLAFIDHPSFHAPDAEQIIVTDAASIPTPDSSWLLPRMNDEASRLCEPVAQLSAEQERSLFMQFNYCRSRAAASAASTRDGAEVAGGELLTWHRKAIAIRNQIVESYLPFVVFLAGRGDNGHKYRIDGYDFADIVSEGARGLIRAVELNNMQGPFRPHAAIAIKGYFSHLIDKARTYRRVYRAELEGNPDQSIAGQIGSESMRLWRSQKQDDNHVHLVEQLRLVLDENRAGLTELERTILESRYRDAQGKKPLKGIDRIARVVHLSSVRVRDVLRTVMSKLRAALDRATVLTRVAQLVIARRLRGEATADELMLDMARSRERRSFGAWGAHLMQFAQAVGIDTYQQLAQAIGVTVASAWKMLHHQTMPTLRHSTRESLCCALKIEPIQLALSA